MEGIQPILTVIQKETGSIIKPLLADLYARVSEGMATRKGDFAHVSATLIGIIATMFLLERVTPIVRRRLIA